MHDGFRIGDRVVFVKEDIDGDLYPERLGHHGTVVTFDVREPTIGVHFDAPVDTGHSLMGHPDCPFGHGLWVYPSNIQHLHPDEVSDE